MKRAEMLKAAVSLAIESVHGATALPEWKYAELNRMDQEKALRHLAKEILEEAAFDVVCE